MCALGSDREHAIELELLRSRVPGVGSDLGSWKRALEAQLAGPAHADDASLLRLKSLLGLSELEVLVCALAIASERDPVTGRALAYLQRPVGGSRPTLGLLATGYAFLCEPGRSPLDVLLGGPAFLAGLLTTSADDAPLVERALLVPPHLLSALRGLPADREGARVYDPRDLVRLSPHAVQHAARLARGLHGKGRGLIIRSSTTGEGRAAAHAVAEALALTPLFLSGEDTHGLAPWLLARDLLPVFERSLAPAQRCVIPPIAGYAGPRVVLAGRDGTLELEGGSALSWELTVPHAVERAFLWERSLGDGALASALAPMHRHGAERIAELSALARQRAAVENRKVQVEDVVEVALSSDACGLDGYAQRVTHRIERSALVLPELLQRELDLLLLRCRGREQLATGLGAATQNRYGPGVRALLVGASGTGKTLSASWLATQLGYPLYRVDLASIVSKYIGETEKNLSQLLSRAEQAEVVLLFDEADSLFGKRTDVKQANDRFANTQTNYLLQRMETYDGIVVLTSNSRARFDAAFTRRLDFIIEFQAPQAGERRALWLAHLGDHHALTPGQLNQLAVTVDLVGGHIKNVVLTAAVLAQHEQRAIQWDDLVIGLDMEYRKLGKQLPGSLLDAATNPGRRVRADQRSG